MDALLDWIGGLLIRMSVVGTFVTLVAVGISYVVLRSTGLYKHRAFLVGVPATVTIAFGSLGVEDYTNLQQWTVCTALSLVLAPLFVSRLFRPKEKQKKPAE